MGVILQSMKFKETGMIDFDLVIDWFSIKLQGVTVALAMITGDSLLLVLTGISVITTIVYNVVKTIKEIKNKK